MGIIKETALGKEIRLGKFLKAIWGGFSTSIHIWLFGDFFKFWVTRDYGFQSELSILTSKHWHISCNICLFTRFEKYIYVHWGCHRTCPFSVYFTLFGQSVSLYWGDYRHDGYDEHLDKYYDFEPLEKAYPELEFSKLDAMIPYSRREEKVFREYYISRLFRIYADDVANDKHSVVLEIALPFLRYFEVSFKRPWGNALWIGIETWLGGNLSWIKLSFLNHDLLLSFDKNDVKRDSNLATEKAIERFLDLNGDRNISFGDLRYVYERKDEKWPLLCRKIRERKAKKS